MLVQKWHFIGSIVAGLVSMAATVSVPIMLGGGIGAVADGDTPPFVAGLFGLAIIRFVFGFTYRFGLFRSALRIEKDLRNLMYERLTELSFDFWDRTQSGQVISRANTDIRSIQLLFAFGPLVAMQVVLFFFAVVVMLTVDITLTLAIAPTAVRLCHRRPVAELRVPVAVGGHGAPSRMATIVDENIQGIRVVKAFNQESAQVQNLARATRASAGRHRRRRHPRPPRTGHGITARLGLALVLLYGGLQTIDGELAIGDLVAFSTYVVLLATPFRLLGFILIQWQRGAAAIRVFDILDETPSIVEPNDAVALPDPAGRIEFDDVHFAYPVGEGEPVLRGFTATIEPGESVAIVGATGSGKSTIADSSPASTTSTRAVCASTATMSARSHSATFVGLRPPSPTTLLVRGLGQQCALRPPRCLRQGGQPLLRTLPPATSSPISSMGPTPRSANGASPCPAVNVSDSPSPEPCSPTHRF